MRMRMLGYHPPPPLVCCPLPLQEPQKPDLTTGESFGVRRFGLEDKRLPGNVRDAVSSGMVTVETPTETVRRHMDQARARQPVAG